MIELLTGFFKDREKELGSNFELYKCGIIQFKTDLVSLEYDFLVLDEDGALIALFYIMDSSRKINIQNIIYKAGLLRSFLEGQTREDGWFPWTVHLFFICKGDENEELYKTIHDLNLNSKVLDLLGISSLESTKDLSQYIKDKKALSDDKIFACERFFAPFLFSLRIGSSKNDFKYQREKWEKIIREELEPVFEKEDDNAATVPQEIKSAVKNSLKEIADALISEGSGEQDGELVLKAIEKVNIVQFRRLYQMNFALHQYNVLYGPNGTGKTSLLEALELGLTGDVARLSRVSKQEKEDILNNPDGKIKVACLNNKAEGEKRECSLKINHGKAFVPSKNFKSFCLSQDGLREFINSDESARKMELVSLTGFSGQIKDIFHNAFEKDKHNIERCLEIFQEKISISRNQKDYTGRFLDNLGKILEPDYIKKAELIKGLYPKIGFAEDGYGRELTEQIEIILSVIAQLHEAIETIKGNLSSGKPVEEIQLDLLEKHVSRIKELRGIIIKIIQPLLQILQDIKTTEVVIERYQVVQPKDFNQEELKQKIKKKKDEFELLQRLYEAVHDYIKAFDAYANVVRALDKARVSLDTSRNDKQRVDQLDLDIDSLQRLKQHWDQLNKYINDINFPQLIAIDDVGNKAYNELVKLHDRLKKEKEELNHEISAYESQLKKPLSNQDEIDAKINNFFEKLNGWLKIEGRTLEYAKGMLTRLVDLRGLLTQLNELPSKVLNVDLEEFKELIRHYYDLPQNNDEETPGSLYWLFRWKLLHDKEIAADDAFKGALNKILSEEVAQVFREILWTLTAVGWTYPVPSIKFGTGRRGGVELKTNIPGYSQSSFLDVIYNTAEQNLVCLAWFFTVYLYLGRTNSKVIILDDPFQSLDDINLNTFVRNFDRILHYIGVEQVILSLHQLDVARYLFEFQASDVHVLNEGENSKQKVAKLTLWRENQSKSTIKLPFCNIRRQELKLDALKRYFKFIPKKSI